MSEGVSHYIGACEGSNTFSLQAEVQEQEDSEGVSQEWKDVEVKIDAGCRLFAGRGIRAGIQERKGWWLIVADGVSVQNNQRWSAGEMSKYVPFLHSEASHLLPLYPIGTIFAFIWNWHYELHEDVLGFMWVVLLQIGRAESTQWPPKP